MNHLKQVTNWNGYPGIRSKVFRFRTSGELRRLLLDQPTLIARGSGLSYGDASLGEHIVSTVLFNKIISFDRITGIIRAESGVKLEELLKIIVPEGWFLPVTPGTKYITLGGAVAADIHGKNHHIEGSFSRYIHNLKIMMADGVEINCSPTESPDLFNSTCGGMGLTGVIMEVDLKLKKIETSEVLQKNIVCPNLKSLISAIKHHRNVTYSVAWIDCLARDEHLGRGVLMLGEHAKIYELPESRHDEPYRLHKRKKFKIPFYLPSFVLSPYPVRIFNHFFYLKHKMTDKPFLAHYDKFFYPLDFIDGWNKLYGKRGFLQYQFVIPFDGAEDVLAEILNKIGRSGYASFLGVLKLLGSTESSLSFPMKGFTLALDMPISKGLFGFLDKLDQIVVKNGGRLYLAKDARTKKEMLKGYPNMTGFRDIRKLTGAKTKFESLMSKRLKL